MEASRSSGSLPAAPPSPPHTDHPPTNPCLIHLSKPKRTFKACVQNEKKKIGTPQKDYQPLSDFSDSTINTPNNFTQLLYVHIHTFVLIIVLTSEIMYFTSLYSLYSFILFINHKYIYIYNTLMVARGDRFM